MQKVISADGTALALDVCGSGPPLVIVGGAFHDRRVAPDLVALLESRFTVVRYDRRGRGSSTGAFTPAEQAVRCEIADLQAVLAEVGGGTPVYGVTTGGVLALRAAASGVPVGPLAVFEPPFRPNRAPRPLRQVLPTLQHLIRSRRYDAAVAYYLAATTCSSPQEIDRLRSAPVWPLLEQAAPALVLDALLVGDHRVPAAVLRRVTAPVLALASADSPAWCAEAARAVAATVRSGRHRVLAGTRHDVPAGPLAEVLAAFVDSAA